MTASASSLPTAPIAFSAYWRDFAGQAGARLWLAVAVLVLIGVLEGSGLLLLVPLLSALGLGSAGQVGGFAGSAAALLPRDGAPSTLALILAFFVTVKAGQAGLRAWSGTLNLQLETDFVCFLRDRFYRAMMASGWLFLTRQRFSDLSQALLGELPMVGHGTRQLLSLLSVAILAVVQIVIAFSFSPAMTSLALASGAIVGLGLRRFRQRSLTLGHLGHGKRAEMAAAVTEHLAGLKIAKSHGRETQHFTHFQRAMNDIAAHTMRLQRVGALMGIWLEAGAVVALSLFVWLAVEVRHVNTAPLLILVFVFTRLLSHVTLLQNLWHQVTEALPSFAATERLRAQLLAAAEPPPPPAVQPIHLRTGITLEHLTFRYDSAQPATALCDLDLLIPARRVTALCGPSGAGKSTLADLVLGLLPATSGRILLDGTVLAGDRLHAWRQSIGYVPQEPFLFNETVRANLLWAQPGATETELRSALRSAAAEHFVDRLPQGLDTLVGDRGVRLSGGERQRIALARAFLRDAPILLLDEATSALDAESEARVQEALERLSKGRTTLVIAHRLSTVRAADRILVMDKGRVVEMGSHDTLVAKGGAYANLARLQLQA